MSSFVDVAGICVGGTLVGALSPLYVSLSVHVSGVGVLAMCLQLTAAVCLELTHTGATTTPPPLPPPIGLHDKVQELEPDYMSPQGEHSSSPSPVGSSGSGTSSIHSC